MQREVRRVEAPIRHDGPESRRLESLFLGQVGIAIPFEQCCVGSDSGGGCVDDFLRRFLDGLEVIVGVVLLDAPRFGYDSQA
ncbi:hypothetical protein DQ240_08740 [Blastococcus sp. TF02A-26]|nr:hypothetical protein DQ240_08710 [Blastococcus sp. TF02A-26]RBY86875.1 hypothetical protein DQ240_08740 [Blastococcus sp. TF02A-26]